MPDFEARARKVLPPVLGHYTWLSIERGEGSWLVTTDGRRVLDMTCGIAVTVVGHSHPRVVKAVVDQVQRLMHISAGVAKYESSIALAEQLATITPRGLDTVLEHEVPPEHVAAIVIEPVLGEGGYVAAPASFLRALRELATRIGALLVFDEVQTGMGRTGAWFAAQKFGVIPDVLTAAKALGGGMPLGAVISTRERMEKWRTGTHGSTFGGNPVSCASGLATLEVIRDENLVARAETIGEIMVEELAPLRSHPRLREIRRFGAMVAAEFDEKSVAKGAIAAALDRDVLLITCGFHDQVVRFIPALNIGEADLRKGMRTFVEAARSAQVASPA